MKLIKEGLARIAKFERVFYNARARFNRSLGVVFIYTLSYLHGRDLTIADALSATGIRGIRYYVESGVIDEIYFNDRSRNAFKNILYNISLNGIVRDSNVSKYDFSVFMSNFSHVKFDLIDVDPFGSPIEYIPSTFYNLFQREGVLSITATDLMTLCGIHLDALKRRYDVSYYRSDICHEVAIRILVAYIYRLAVKYDYYVEPILGTFENNYIRLYLAYYRGPSKFRWDKLGFLTYDEKNGFAVIRLKDGMDCCSDIKGGVIGPIWIGPYVNKDFLSSMIKKSEDLSELSELTREYSDVYKYLRKVSEDNTNIPYIYRISNLCKRVKCIQPPIRYILSSLSDIGYEAYRAYLYGDGIRTNAPLYILESILKAYSSV